MQKVTAKDLLNEQERRLQKMRQQEKDNDVDWNAKSVFLEKPYYMTQVEKQMKIKKYKLS